MIGITGSTGFIGSYICRHLHFPKKVLVRNSAKLILDATTDVYQGDLTALEDAHAFLQDCTYLIHLACNSNPRLSEGRLVADLEYNLLPTIQLFESYAKNNPEGHIIFASSGGNMYEDHPQTLPKTEDDIPKPRSGYGVHKLAAEHYLRLIAESYGIGGTILRISNPYGAIVDRARSQGLIGVAFAKLHAQEILQVYDSCETLRDYIHLDDVVKVLNIMLSRKEPSKNIETYNISSGVGISIAQVIAEVEAVTGKKMLVEYTRESLQKRPSWSILSMEKAKKELGWHPTVSLRDGLMRMQKLFQTTQHL